MHFALCAAKEIFVRSNNIRPWMKIKIGKVKWIGIDCMKTVNKCNHSIITHPNLIFNIICKLSINIK